MLLVRTASISQRYLMNQLKKVKQLIYQPVDFFIPNTPHHIHPPPQICISVTPEVSIASTFLDQMHLEYGLITKISLIRFNINGKGIIQLSDEWD